MSSDQPNDPQSRKIIIDEDWKSQVEREREEFKSSPNSEPSVPQSELPPASIQLLITTIATQAMAAMGQIPDPLEKKPIMRIELARHHIDMLALLEDKTRGNLTEEERQLLDSVQHQLRLIFVEVDKQVSDN